MNGLGANVTVIGEGTVQWCFRDDFGVLRKVRVKAYLYQRVRLDYLTPKAILSKRIVGHSP